MPTAPPTFKQTTVKRYRTLARKIRASKRWRRLSEQKRTADPYCQDPRGLHAEANEYAPFADDVHHIRPIAERPDMAFDWDNLASVCRRCHKQLDLEQEL